MMLFFTCGQQVSFMHESAYSKKPDAEGRLINPENIKKLNGKVGVRNYLSHKLRRASHGTRFQRDRHRANLSTVMVDEI